MTASTTPFLIDQCQNAEIEGQATTVMTVQRAYAISYWCINLGSLAAFATSQLERRDGYWAAYLLPNGSQSLALLILIFGSNEYAKVIPSGTILKEVVGIVRVAMRKRSDPLVSSK